MSTAFNSGLVTVRLQPSGSDLSDYLYLGLSSRTSHGLARLMDYCELVVESHL